MKNQILKNKAKTTEVDGKENRQYEPKEISGNIETLRNFQVTSEINIYIKKYQVKEIFYLYTLF